MSVQYLIKLPYNVKKLLGSKGEKLNFLLDKNFKVPLTYCVSEDAYELFIEINKLWAKLDKTFKNPKLSFTAKSKIIFSSLQDAILPNELADEIIKEKIFIHENKKWAVRSSSNMEDLVKTSFAGIYDSFLNITGSQNILDSIKNCWISLWNERALIYRSKNKLSHSKSRMAVIIQEMVESHYAGVIFTRNPLNLKNDEMLLEYCEGIGENLVSGKVTPYSCIISRSTQNIRHIRKPKSVFFDDEEIKRLFRVAFEVVRCCGYPQDIEWAFDGKEYNLLQTRPVTHAVPHKCSTIDNIWTRANIGEVLPNVVTPLTWDIFRATLFKNTAQIMKSSVDYSIFDEAIKLINGRGYLELKFFLDSFCYLPYVTPEIMKQVLGVDVISQTSSYKRPKGISVKIAQLLFLLNAFKIYPRISLILKRLPDIPSRETNNLEKIIQWNVQCFHLHIKCTTYSIGSFALLTHYLHKWFPSRAEELISLILTGKENLQTANQGISLWEISNFIIKKQDLKNIIERKIKWTELMAELEDAHGGSQLVDLLRDFLSKNGVRTVGEFELAVPRWKEDPDFILNIIRKYLKIPNREFSPECISNRRRKRENSINDIKASLNKFQKIIFNQLLISYSNFCTLRENIKYRLMEGYSAIRIVLLDIANQLVSREILVDKNDIFFMRLSEVLSTINETGSHDKLNRLIVNRKIQHEKWQSQNVSELVFQDGIQMHSTEESRKILNGIGCSPGIVKGFARVLKDISEMNKLQNGEILVTSHTDPGWTPLFLSCGGLVTEIGGFLSHGSTVAREYGIPAVVNVRNVLKKIQTGDYIMVNGNEGEVIVYDDESHNGQIS